MVVRPINNAVHDLVSDFSNDGLRAQPSTKKISGYFSKDARFVSIPGGYSFNKKAFKTFFKTACEDQVLQLGKLKTVIESSKIEEYDVIWRFKCDQCRKGYGEELEDLLDDDEEEGGWLHIKAEYGLQTRIVDGQIKICKLVELSSSVLIENTTEKIDESPFFGSKARIMAEIGSS